MTYINHLNSVVDQIKSLISANCSQVDAARVLKGDIKTLTVQKGNPYITIEPMGKIKENQITTGKVDHIMEFMIFGYLFESKDEEAVSKATALGEEIEEILETYTGSAGYWHTSKVNTKYEWVADNQTFMRRVVINFICIKRVIK